MIPSEFPQKVFTLLNFSDSSDKKQKRNFQGRSKMSVYQLSSLPSDINTRVSLLHQQHQQQQQQQYSTDTGKFYSLYSLNLIIIF